MDIWNAWVNIDGQNKQLHILCSQCLRNAYEKKHRRGAKASSRLIALQAREALCALHTRLLSLL
jgi:hypothetical protein